MERATRRIGYRSIIVFYFVCYLIAMMNHQFVWTAILRPGAAIIAYYGLYYVIKVNGIYDKAITTMRRTFFLWAVVDVLRSTGELSQYFFDYKIDQWFSIVIVLYFIVRIYLFIGALKFYMSLTRKYNRFQRFADIFTILCCVISSLWIIYFSKDTSESIALMLALDFNRIFSELFRLSSMLTLGILLISWFHYQHYRVTLGQRYVLGGVALITWTDLAIAIFNSLMDGILIDIIYAAAILLVAAGCEMYLLHPTKTLFMREKTEEERMAINWKNSFYLISYPIFVIFIVGLRTEMVMYIFIFAFYFVACLYVRQLRVVDIMLQDEKDKNEKLRLYSNVIEQAPLSIVITDIEGNIRYINPYFSETTGYTTEEVMGRNPRFLKSEKTPPDTYISLWKNITAGEKWIGEFRNVDKNGNEYQERAIIAPIAGEDGNTAYYVGLKENITETEKMKHMIDNQSKFIIQLADVIPNSIFHVDKEDRFVGANIEFGHLYQVDPNLYLGMKFEDTPWMNSEKYQTFIEMREESIAMKKPVIRQVTRNIRGEETPVLYCVNAYYLSDGTVGGYLGMMTDVSELKEKELELQNALVQANAATEAKSMFLANMSHEIRTPMNAIIGMSYLALKTDLTDKQRDYIGKINDAATSLLGIINDILDFSKIETGKVTMEKLEFNLDQVISKSIELLVPKAREKDLEFIYHLSCDIPQQLKGDPLRLGQVITNLVSNAVKFTHNGEIRIDVALDKQRESYVRLRFSVADTGIGIAKENQKSLFDAFSQSDNSITRKYGGTGLGLAISKNLVEMMEGELWLESEENSGSTFSFTAWFELPENSNVRRSITLQDIMKIRTLIVDDNSAAREITREYMEYMGITADVAESGKQAIELLQAHDEEDPYHLILIDWKMPELDGVETVRQIYALDSLQNKPAVVFVTAYDTEEMKKYAQGIEVASFLAKPLTQSCLYDAIVNIYAKSFSSLDSPRVYAAEYHFDGTCILLAEDNEVNQQIACELLEGQGCKVEVANNGIEALEYFQRNRDKYDMILMDLQMPEMDGLKATEKIREIDAIIPVIAMTARSMQEEKEMCFKAGMNDHIAKPIDPDALMATIEKWNKRKVLQPSEILMGQNKNRVLSRKNGENNQGTKELDQIYGIDTKMGLIRVAGNVTLYRKLLQRFATEQENTITKIWQGIEKKEWEIAVREAHLLKGVAGNIGASVVYELAYEIEKMAKNEALEDMTMVYRLRDEFFKMSEAISQISPDIGQIPAEEAGNESAVKELLVTLKELLLKGDAAALPYLQDNRSGIKNAVEQDKFERLEKLIEQYEFEEAVNILQEQ